MPSFPGHKIAPLIPFDEHNQRLEAEVHPSDWTNPEPGSPYHLVVIGSGTAGLVTAAGAASLGARVALVEKELMGGDCLNVGCVPSKSILSAARAVAQAKAADRLGVGIGGTTVDFACVMERMRKLRAQISPADSARRFQGLGVDVYFGTGAFLDHHHVQVTDDGGRAKTLTFRKAVIATGARATEPPIEGLSEVAYLTNESIFSLTELPPTLGVLGGGPIGCELAQAFARFGSRVHLVERSQHILSREDADAAEILRQQLETDGLQLCVGTTLQRVARLDDERLRLTLTRDGEGNDREIDVDQLLISVGRTPNIESLNLEAAGVKANRAGVEVDDYLRTSNPHIFAAGDVCSSYKFTHAADFMARAVIQNALFAIGPFGRKKKSDLIIPWTTYTSPEIAHIGMHEREAEESGTAIDTYVQRFEDVDRAVLEGQDRGYVKVHTRKGTDKIVGATIVAEHAGDLISQISVAMTQGLGLAQLGACIYPYPTIAESIRKLGDQYNRSRLTPRNRRLLGWLRWWNVGA